MQCKIMIMLDQEANDQVLFFHPKCWVTVSNQTISNAYRTINMFEEGVLLLTELELNDSADEVVRL